MSLAYRANADFAKLNHPMRVPLSAEIHSRPFLQLQAPESLTHFALYVQQDQPSQKFHRSSQHQILEQLCLHYGVAAPAPQARYFFHDFDRFRLKWECHTEFATYTFVERQGSSLTFGHEDSRSGDDGSARVRISDLTPAFERMPLQHVPQEWLAGLHGKIIVAAHVLLCKGEPDDSGAVRAIRDLFQGKSLVGSSVGSGAEVWTDFLIQPDGFSRFVVRDLSLREFQAGRLVGRLLEIETYRMMALLGLPQAEASQPVLNGIENELADLTATLVQSDQSDGAPNEAREEQALLHRITSLAARLEKLSVNNSYRFAAAQAYFSLVQSRIQELREVRIAGMPTLAEFMGRRLAPAMHTCTSVSQRQETLAKRIARSNDLLRTRVGIEQERQNRKILQSLDARAAQQLRLQQAVEGLSAVAISYYTLGLIGYAGKAMKASNVPINPDILTGLAAPLVFIGVWMGLRRLHKQLTGPGGALARHA
ncbi:DUF3422 family protein [Duganella violaceipulchra]|uniref:DUF3422 domain-containing protein n=1 Tax=Duganella violaceipulchra TaxID=2849652 RepID=A0AA41L699_9BURK|nr:DUF3422 domain-containing protein [Duganella violaceicalia]MBV6325059.1 DUF3422 domain-containing protein [Duganella violaceicalia]MCP2010571.1 putative membrane-anchored protein [Duganella violaceicalia]